MIAGLVFPTGHRLLPVPVRRTGLAVSALRQGKGPGGELLSGLLAAGQSAGLFVLMVFLAVQNLLCLLQLFRVRLAMGRSLDDLLHQAKRIQQIYIVICIVSNRDRCAEHRFLAVVRQRSVLLLVPADSTFVQEQNAVRRNHGIAKTIGKHRLLRIHIQAV